ncbi:MAG: hypothetical protein WKF77_22630 [Planctomycetaceae bacterium]
MVSTLRWLLIDTLHHRTGILPPKWNFRKLRDRITAYDRLIEIHYRYYQWHSNALIAVTIAKLDPAAVRRDLNETQLFNAEQAGEGEYAGTDALVREILQNFLDAGIGNGPVQVRLELHPNFEGPNAARKASYCRRLESPLSGRQVGFSFAGHLDPNAFRNRLVSWSSKSSEPAASEETRIRNAKDCDAA